MNLNEIKAELWETSIDFAMEMLICGFPPDRVQEMQCQYWGKTEDWCRK